MRGRPRRIPDEALVARLIAIEATSGMSRRSLALALDVDPATLYRSMGSRSFSMQAKLRIERRLSMFEVRPVDVEASGLRPDAKARIMRLLRKIEALLNEAEA